MKDKKPDRYWELLDTITENEFSRFLVAVIWIVILVWVTWPW